MSDNTQQWMCHWSWCSFHTKTRAERNAHLYAAHLNPDALDRECKVPKDEWDIWSRIHLGADGSGDDESLLASFARPGRSRSRDLESQTAVIGGVHLERGVDDDSSAPSSPLSDAPSTPPPPSTLGQGNGASTSPALSLRDVPSSPVQQGTQAVPTSSPPRTPSPPVARQRTLSGLSFSAVAGASSPSIYAPSPDTSPDISHRIQTSVTDLRLRSVSDSPLKRTLVSPVSPTSGPPEQHSSSRSIPAPLLAPRLDSGHTSDEGSMDEHVGEVVQAAHDDERRSSSHVRLEEEEKGAQKPLVEAEEVEESPPRKEETEESLSRREEMEESQPRKEEEEESGQSHEEEVAAAEEHEGVDGGPAAGEDVRPSVELAVHVDVHFPEDLSMAEGSTTFHMDPPDEAAVEAESDPQEDETVEVETTRTVVKTKFTTVTVSPSVSIESNGSAVAVALHLSLPPDEDMQDEDVDELNHTQNLSGQLQYPEGLPISDVPADIPDGGALLGEQHPAGADEPMTGDDNPFDDSAPDETYAPPLEGSVTEPESQESQSHTGPIPQQINSHSLEVPTEAEPEPLDAPAPPSSLPSPPHPRRSLRARTPATPNAATRVLRSASMTPRAKKKAFEEFNEMKKSEWGLTALEVARRRRARELRPAGTAPEMAIELSEDEAAQKNDDKVNANGKRVRNRGPSTSRKTKKRAVSVTSDDEGGRRGKRGRGKSVRPVPEIEPIAEEAEVADPPAPAQSSRVLSPPAPPPPVRKNNTSGPNNANVLQVSPLPRSQPISPDPPKRFRSGVLDLSQRGSKSPSRSPAKSQQRNTEPGPSRPSVASPAASSISATPAKRLPVSAAASQAPPITPGLASRPPPWANTANKTPTTQGPLYQRFFAKHVTPVQASSSSFAGPTAQSVSASGRSAASDRSSASAREQEEADMSQVELLTQAPFPSQDSDTS